MWDFTCVDSFASSHIKETSKVAGSAAEKTEKLKLSKYEEIRNDYYMVPIAVETLDSWGPEGLQFIKCIGNKAKGTLAPERKYDILIYEIRSWPKKQASNMPVKC